MTEIEKLTISEAKEYLAETNNGISKTRDKSWQLLGFIIAIDVYLIQSLISGNNLCLFIIMIGSCIISPIIIHKLYYSLEPQDMSFNGFEPNRLKPFFTNEPKLNNSIIHSYQLAITENKTILTKLSTNYKKAINWTLLLIGFAVAIVFVFLLSDMFVESDCNRS